MDLTNMGEVERLPWVLSGNRIFTFITEYNVLVMVCASPTLRQGAAGVVYVLSHWIFWTYFSYKS